MSSYFKPGSILLLLIFSSLACHIKAQATNQDTVRRSVFLAGITPTSLININTGIQASAGINFSDKMALHAETAWIFYSFVKDHTMGYRIRVGPRFKFKLFGNPDYFLEPAFNFWHVRYFKEGNFISTDGQWSGSLRYRGLQTMSGFVIHGGKSWDLPHDFRLDYSSGFGLGGLRVKHEGLPPDVVANSGLEQFFPFFSGFSEGSYLYPFLIIHLSIIKKF